MADTEVGQADTEMSRCDYIDTEYQQINICVRLVTVVTLSKKTANALCIVVVSV